MKIDICGYNIQTMYIEIYKILIKFNVIRIFLLKTFTNHGDLLQWKKMKWLAVTSEDSNLNTSLISMGNYKLKRLYITSWIRGVSVSCITFSSHT